MSVTVLNERNSPAQITAAERDELREQGGKTN